MSAPRISVLLPVYNAAGTIQRAVDSILQQTYRDWELIIIDDGSTDGTPGILKELAAHEERIRILTFPENTGIVFALNTGLGAAQGEYIARMDADDFSFPERFRIQADYLDGHPQVGLVTCSVTHGGNADTQHGYSLHIDWMNLLLTHEEIFINRFIESPIAHPSVMFRKEIAELHGKYKEGNFPEDYELWLRWLHAGVKFHRLPEVLFTWADPHARLSRTDARYSSEAFSRIKAKYLAAHLQRMPEITHRPIWLWGAGRVSRRRSDFLVQEGISIAGYIDVDPAKTGKSKLGLPVITPEDLIIQTDAFVISYVGNRGARGEIREWFKAHEREEGVHFIMAG